MPAHAAVLALILSLFALAGSLACATAGTPAGLEERRLTVGDLERSYLLYVPGSYSASKPSALVLAFHGGTGTGKDMARLTGMHELGERYGFIVVYPDGVKKSWNIGGGRLIGAAAEQGIDDVGFVRALLDELRREYAIDGKRIYATGISMGAMLSYRLACQMPETIAAIAPVAGPMTVDDCRPAGRVPVLHIHGTEDENVPLEGGRGRLTARGNVWPPVSRGLEVWRQANGCRDAKQETFRGDGTVCWRYADCSQDATVAYCVVENNGHAWPGQKPLVWQKLLGVPVNQAFPASQRIWEFFAQHPR